METDFRREVRRTTSGIMDSQNVADGEINYNTSPYGGPPYDYEGT